MNISMDPQGLKKVGTNVINDAASYKQNIDKVYRIVNSINSSWAGKDSQQYITKVNSYKKEMESLGNVIKAYGQFIVDVAKEYEKTQNDIKNAFR